MLVGILRYHRCTNMRQVCESFLVDLCKISTAFMLFVELHELTQPHRCLNIGHVVFITFSRDVVPPDVALRLARPSVLVDPVESHRVERLGKRIAIRCNHTAFPCCQIFVRIETKGGEVADTADILSFVFGRNGVGSVINEDEVVVSADVLYSVHIAWETREMHGQYCLCVWCYRLLYLGYVYIQCIRIDVHKDRFCTDVSNRLSSGGESIRRCDDFVAVTDLGYNEAEMQRVGAGN